MMTTSISDLPIEIRRIIVQTAVSTPTINAAEVAGVNREFQQFVTESAPREITIEIGKGLVPTSVTGHVFYKTSDLMVDSNREFDKHLLCIIGMLKNPDRRHDISISIGVETSIDINRFSGCKVLDIGFCMLKNIAPGPDVGVFVYRNYINQYNLVWLLKGCRFRSLYVYQTCSTIPILLSLDTMLDIHLDPGFGIDCAAHRIPIVTHTANPSLARYQEVAQQAGEFVGHASCISLFPNVHTVHMTNCSTLARLNTGPITPVLIPSSDPFKPARLFNRLTCVTLSGSVDNIDSLNTVSELDIRACNATRLPVPNQITHLKCRITTNLRPAINIVDLYLVGDRYGDDTPTPGMPSLRHMSKLESLTICETRFVDDCIIDTPVKSLTISTTSVRSAIIADAAKMVVLYLNSPAMRIINNANNVELIVRYTIITHFDIPRLRSLDDCNMTDFGHFNCPDLVKINCKKLQVNPDQLVEFTKLRTLTIGGFTRACRITATNFPALRELTILAGSHPLTVAKKLDLLSANCPVIREEPI